MPRFAANLSMLFTELPFMDRFAAARMAGFEAVEYLFPYAYPKDELARALRENGLKQVAHNLPAGDWEAGDRGIACQPERVGEFRAGVVQCIEYATALGCPQVNCLAGKVPAGVQREDAHSTFVGNLRHAAQALKRAGIRLLIEPINPFDIPEPSLSGGLFIGFARPYFIQPKLSALVRAIEHMAQHEVMSGS